jgi:hypothetical protein
MMRRLSLTLATISFLVVGSVSGKLRAGLPIRQEIPKTATVEIILLGAPGINEEGSNWEIAYEFRIANQATCYEAWKQGKFKDGSRERVGELIKEGDVKKIFQSRENRKVLFQIPFSPQIQEKLRNEPRNRFKFTPGKITPEEIKLSREQEMRAQSFLFYSVINLYDARLKKTLMIPARFHWPFGSYPQARFEIKIAINNDGSYSVNTSLPAETASN